ncbi:MAG: hypothetical protein RL711_163 [Bacteroidota bacterium]
MKNMLLIVLLFVLAITIDVRAQTINFPDANFKNAILDNGVDLETKTVKFKSMRPKHVLC